MIGQGDGLLKCIAKWPSVISYRITSGAQTMRGAIGKSCDGNVLDAGLHHIPNPQHLQSTPAG